ncbi:MAG TPA: asparagine synthase (glutamine-hydrolyzing) [Vicinamibacterales bacterium]
MCGICGQLNYGRPGAPVERGIVERMAGSIAHRGPDDEGYFFADGLGLGFRRLSIIDLAGGHQPMSDETESVWVAFNGEIYNYRELRQELEPRGHRFRTSSDTEVIVHGYKEWGTGVFARLNGMFGLAIWDVARRRLVVARDPMGIKLVYYHDDGRRLTFGSEIRAVLAGIEGRPSVDPTALSLFLGLRYTPSPLTILEGIRKLPPGCLLIVENGLCRQERWYQHTPEPFPESMDEGEAVEELLRLYRGAVARHLLSDVPVGILLSGGLDSALLLALMNEHGSRWPAFTVGYGSAFADDELADAADTARALGAEHVPVMLDQATFERALPLIVAQLEEPIASSSVVPMYFVSERARLDVKVAIIGQGPDELFCGYTRHVGVRYGEVWRTLPGVLRRAVGRGVSGLGRREALKRGLYALGTEDRLERYQRVFSLAPAATITSLFRKGVLPGGFPLVGEWCALQPQMARLDDLGGFQLLELRSSLPDELLMFADKLSMAHGLEGRVPYLDRTVVEFALRLPARLKMRRGRGKWIHREVCRRFLPQAILERPKRGFAVNVVDGWFQKAYGGGLSDMLLDPGSLMYDLLDHSAVSALLADHRAGLADNHKLLFSLAMFEAWLRGADAPRPVAASAC